MDAASEDGSLSNYSNASNAEKISEEKRRWTSGNLELIKEFDNEAELDDWFKNEGGGENWIIECNRNTKLHHVTEYICRYSSKYSSRRVECSPYNCHARLRVRRPLDSSELRNLILVEKTSIDHNHSPQRDKKSPMSDNISVKSELIESSSKGMLDVHSNKAKSEEYGEFEVQDEPVTSSISAEDEEFIHQKYYEFGWDVRRLQNEMFRMRMRVPTFQQITELYGRFEREKCLDILDQKKAVDDKVSEFTERVALLGKGINDSMEANAISEQLQKEQFALENSEAEAENVLHQSSHNLQANSGRARRVRRVYSPSPPPSLGGEPGRIKRQKKEKSIEGSDFTPKPAFDLKWAKAPPSLSSSLGSNGFSATAKKGVNNSFSAEIPQTKENSSEQLVNRNNKLAYEIVQLRRQNQEQQQQIQALINANRELIWAFNESRREHGELMQQLRALTGKQGGNPAAGGASGLRNPPSKAVARPQKKYVVNSRQNKKQGIYVAPDSLPPSLAILNKQSTVGKSSADHRHDFDPHSAKTEQLLADVQKEIEERGVIESSNADHPVQIDAMKKHLEDLPNEPDVDKFIGKRKPAFYTPTEYGDWHSVMSSIQRKQIVFQLFEAVCPELSHERALDFTKTFASRSDYLRKLQDYVYDAENRLFVAAGSRDAYFTTVAVKVIALREVVAREMGSLRNELNREEAKMMSSQKRTLADILKPKRSSKPVEDEEIKM